MCFSCEANSQQDVVAWECSYYELVIVCWRLRSLRRQSCAMYCITFLWHIPVGPPQKNSWNTEQHVSEPWKIPAMAGWLPFQEPVYLTSFHKQLLHYFWMLVFRKYARCTFLVLWVGRKQFSKNVITCTLSAVQRLRSNTPSWEATWSSIHRLKVAMNLCSYWHHKQMPELTKW